MHNFIMSGEAATANPPAPAKLVRGIVELAPIIALVTDKHRERLPAGKKLPYWDADLIYAVMELEDVPMDSLSPQLQDMKLGFKQLSLDPSKPKGVERRINEALRLAGEPGIKTVFSEWRIDHSTVPPSRIRKTDRERLESVRESQERIRELEQRKPELYTTIEEIVASAKGSSDDGAQRVSRAMVVASSVLR